MQTEAWGEHQWNSMFFIAFGSPEVFEDKHKQFFKTHYENLANVLPCSLCRDAYGKMIIHVPIDSYLTNRYDLCYWVFVIHNLVNIKLQKHPYDFVNTVYKYENCRARCGVNDGSEKFNLCKKFPVVYSMEEAKILAKNTIDKNNEKTVKFVCNYYNALAAETKTVSKCVV